MGKEKHLGEKATSSEQKSVYSSLGVFTQKILEAPLDCTTLWDVATRFPRQKGHQSQNQGRTTLQKTVKARTVTEKQQPFSNSQTSQNRMVRRPNLQVPATF